MLDALDPGPLVSEGSTPLHRLHKTLKNYRYVLVMNHWEKEDCAS